MLRPYTLNLDDSLMHAAKMRAVQEKTSVSEIVRRLLSRYLGVGD
jgi:plasmid stability protein